jgi:hypothetical protein
VVLSWAISVVEINMHGVYLDEYPKIRAGSINSSRLTFKISTTKFAALLTMKSCPQGVHLDNKKCAWGVCVDGKSVPVFRNRASTTISTLAKSSVIKVPGSTSIKRYPVGARFTSPNTDITNETLKLLIIRQEVMCVIIPLSPARLSQISNCPILWSSDACWAPAANYTAVIKKGE